MATDTSRNKPVGGRREEILFEQTGQNATSETFRSQGLPAVWHLNVSAVVYAHRDPIDEGVQGCTSLEKSPTNISQLMSHLEFARHLPNHTTAFISPQLTAGSTLPLYPSPIPCSLTPQPLLHA